IQSNSRKSTWSIDQSNHRYAEFFAKPHQTQRFPVTFRMGAPEIAHHVFLRVAPFLVSNNYTALRSEHRKTARHGFVIGKAAIPMQFNPVCKASVDVIEGERPLNMPRDLNTLPGGQVTVYLAASFLQLFLKRLNRGIKIDIM